MAKYNDMPESDSAKVFLTNLFIKEHLKPPCPPPLNTGNYLHPLRHFAQTIRQSQQNFCFNNIQRKMKTRYLTGPGKFCPKAGLPGNSDMNGFTVYGINRNNCWLKDEPMNFAKNVHQRRP